MWLEVPVIDVPARYPFTEEEVTSLPRVALPAIRARVVKAQTDDLLLPSEACDKWRVIAHRFYFSCLLYTSDAADE